MITLECTSVDFMLISKRDEFLHRLIANEMTPPTTVKPPPCLIDQYHGLNVTPPPRERGPPCELAPKLNVQRLPQHPLQRLPG